MSDEQKNDITELRGHLFDALRGLSRTDNPMEIERAKAVCDVAQTIINSAKVEVEMVKATGGQGSGFIPNAGKALPPPAPNGSTVAVLVNRAGVKVTRHKLAG